MESKFKRQLEKDILALYPDAEIVKNNTRQGFPDITIYWREHFALVETKDECGAHYQPNQNWYIEKFQQYTPSYSVYPENKEEFLHDLQFAFGPYE
jgi:hypothetical protein